VQRSITFDDAIEVFDASEEFDIADGTVAQKETLDWPTNRFHGPKGTPA